MHACNGWINIVCNRCSSHKDALHVVDPLSSKDLVVVVDFQRFTDCHAVVVTSTPIFFNRGRERRSSDYRRFLSKPGSAWYSSTPPRATVWSIYQTIFNDSFEVYFTKVVTLSPIVQTDFSFLFNSCRSNHMISHSSLWLVNRLTADEYCYYDHKYVNIHRHQLFVFSKSIMDNRWQRLFFNAKLACGKKASY